MSCCRWKWIYQGALSHTGASYQWFRDNYYQEFLTGEIDPKYVFNLMNDDAAKAEAGSGGVVFLPYMLGERSPIWDPYARGVFFGISLHTGRKEMNRAIMEGCGYGLKQLADIAEKVTGREIKSFVSIGGGAKSTVWAQIKADITGKDIEILDMNDMAPIGAALLAGVGANVFKDVYEAADLDGATGFKRFSKITFPLLAPSFTINMVLSAKGYLMVYDQIMAMTDGGPGTATTSIAVLIYKKGFGGGQFAYQSANAVVLFIVVVLISVFQLRILEKREEKLG